MYLKGHLVGIFKKGSHTTKKLTFCYVFNNFPVAGGHLGCFWLFTSINSAMNILYKAFPEFWEEAQ